jgi:tRNA-splicing ligase RtcB
MGLGLDALGIVPGSMGTATYHVRGRAHPDALRSSAHGAGRAMTRTEARRRIRPAQLARENRGVWYDHRLAHRLCEEAPSAYKDVDTVMRAQRELVKIVRRLRPLLVYKAV